MNKWGIFRHIRGKNGSVEGGERERERERERKDLGQTFEYNIKY
jgi:hypothetical protein